MSDAQFDAAAAILSQSVRDQIKHLRWKKTHGFEGLVSVHEAKESQQAIDATAGELQKAKAAYERARAAVQKAT
eukprot:1352790-Pyramimonas_sp.AAC.1